MSSLTWLEPRFFWMLPLVSIWVFFAAWQYRKNRIELKKYRSHKDDEKRLKPDAGISIILAVVCLIIAAARPAWNPHPSPIKDNGRDIIFLLDVSRSMLADDVRPNRLEIAKTAISQTFDGNCTDRYGLAAFAGVTSILSPLTCDQTFFTGLMEGVGPGSVIQGGTNIGEALMTVIKRMINEEDDARSVDIILITDGEDLGEYPEAALAEINRLGARFLVVGLGDSQFGARVPARTKSRLNGGWVMNNGREHWSKLNNQNLQAMAEGVEQGIYFPVGTAWLDLPGLLDQLKVLWPGELRAGEDVMDYTEGYPWLLAAAVLLLGFSLLKPGFRVKSLTIAALALLALTANASEVHGAEAKSIQALEAEAVARVASGAFLDAYSLYQMIAEQATTMSTAVAANYNAATATLCYARSVQKQRADFMLDPDFNQADLDAMDDPEFYFEQARRTLRDILLTTPDHQPSRRNLEWLSKREYDQLQQSPQQNQMQPDDLQQRPDQNQNDTQDDGKDQQEQGEKESQPAEQEGDKPEEQEAADSEGSKNSDSQTEGLTLPKPNTSAEDVLSNSQARQNAMEQEHRKQIPVERDW